MSDFDPQQSAFNDDFENQDAPTAPERYWTGRRILITLVILITLLAFLAYTFSGLFQPPIRLPELPPPPTIGA